jgi:hypothetical protein
LVVSDIAFHEFSGVYNSFLYLLQPVHHAIKVIMNKLLMLFNLLFDEPNLRLIISSELLIKVLQVAVKLLNLIRLLIGSLHEIR